MQPHGSMEICAEAGHEWSCACFQTPVSHGRWPEDFLVKASAVHLLADIGFEQDLSLPLRYVQATLCLC